MTARVTTLKGVDAGLYYVEALPSYYLDTDEPAGRWQGRGADLSGLRGEIEDADFLDIMAGIHPHSGGATLGRAYGDESVRGFDITASAPKSVSTLFALGDPFVRAEVLAAHDAAVAAMVGWVEDHAHTRYRINGQVSIVDAEGIIAATFRQHTSRALDPQLHTHVVLANRVRSPDGRWLALDARTIKLDQRTLSAIYHATLRAQLTTNIGIDWRPVENGIAEMAAIPDVVLEEFSARTADIARRTDEKLDRFIDTFGRDPTPRERWRLEREAVIDSRPAKAQNVDASALHAQWAGQVETIGLDPTRVADDPIGTQRLHRLNAKTRDQIIGSALSSLSESQSSWRPAEVTREIAAALPANLAIDPAEIPRIVDNITTRAIRDRCVDISRPVPEGEMVRKDGRPVTESVADRALTTAEILAQEERILAWAERRMSHIPIDSADAPKRAAVELSVPQAETAAAVAGDAHLVLVVGPAGTGKTTALRPAVKQLHADGRVVFGVAPSAAAAQVLGEETGVAADTIDKLLTEHSLKRPPTHLYDLPAGATVVVDEAGMVATNTLDRLAALADDKAWRVALVGDPMQFSAVGRGGMYQHLVDTHGAIELDRVHRFTNPWERDGSLRLRRGDPTVAHVYDLEGRLHGGTAARMEREALDAWWSARHRGETVVIAAPTNDAVARLNHAAQQRRIDAGELAAGRRQVEANGYRFFVGDEIATRQNDRQLHTDHGLMIRNRDQWAIDTIHRNGDLTITGRTGTTRLPAHYVRQHVELAYAQTSHATQGRTVDRSILVLDGPTDVRGIYVPMTRGRHRNEAYIVTAGEQTALDVFGESISRSWIDQPAHARQVDLTDHNPHRPGTLGPDRLRDLLGRQGELTERLDRLNDDLDTLPGLYEQKHRWHHHANVELTSSKDRLQEAFDTVARYDRPLRRRGNETAIRDAKLTIQHLPDKMREQATRVRELASEVRDIDHRLSRSEQRAHHKPALEAELQAVTGGLREDRNVRLRQISRNPPGRVVKELGARPAERKAADRWDRAAARLDQHHAAFAVRGAAKLAKLPAFTFSRALIADDKRRLDHAIALERRRSLQREGPALRRGR